MIRVIVGTAVGMIAGMLALAGWGGYYGYHNGVPSAQLPPGWEAAGVSALGVSVFLFWMGLLPGALIGGAAGFASWLVRPRVTRRRAVPVAALG
jgi:hypothetical protein